MSYRDSLQLLPILSRFYQATCRLETRIQFFQLIARSSRCVPCCAAVARNCVESRHQSGHMMSRIRFRLRMAGAKSWETPHDELSRNTSILTLHIEHRPLVCPPALDSRDLCCHVTERAFQRCFVVHPIAPRNPVLQVGEERHEFRIRQRRLQGGMVRPRVLAGGPVLRVEQNLSRLRVPAPVAAVAHSAVDLPGLRRDTRPRPERREEYPRRRPSRNTYRGTRGTLSL